MSGRIGIGLIGAGKHGARYASHIVRDFPRFSLAAVSRKDPERGRALAADLSTRFHPDWRDLVADPDVSAVVAVVPPTLHRPIVEATASANKALLIEKPLATTTADAMAIVGAVRRADIPCLMAHTLRWNAVVRAIREVLPTLGPLRALGLNQRFEVSPLDWLDRPELSGGGIPLHTGVHSFDLVRHLTGSEVRRVLCATSQVTTSRTPDNFAAVLELRDSTALVTVTGCRATGGRSGLIDAACAEGQLVADHQLHWAYRTRGLERTSLDLPPPTLTVREVLASFDALLERGTAPPVTLVDGARAVQLAEACATAASLARTVEISDLPAT